MTRTLDQVVSGYRDCLFLSHRHLHQYAFKQIQLLNIKAWTARRVDNDE
jgi:hypothetical protein